MLTKMETGDFFGEIGILNLDGGINRWETITLPTPPIEYMYRHTHFVLFSILFNFGFLRVWLFWFWGIFFYTFVFFIFYTFILTYWVPRTGSSNSCIFSFRANTCHRILIKHPPCYTEKIIFVQENCWREIRGIFGTLRPFPWRRTWSSQRSPGSGSKGTFFYSLK